MLSCQFHNGDLQTKVVWTNKRMVQINQIYIILSLNEDLEFINTLRVADISE